MRIRDDAVERRRRISPSVPVGAVTVRVTRRPDAADSRGARLTDSPTGLADGIAEKFYVWTDHDGDLERSVDLEHPPRSFAEQIFNIQRWTDMPRGGHFAALEAPALLAADVATFFRSLRGR